MVQSWLLSDWEPSQSGQANRGDGHRITNVKLWGEKRVVRESDQWTQKWQTSFLELPEMHYLPSSVQLQWHSKRQCPQPFLTNYSLIGLHSACACMHAHAHTTTPHPIKACVCHVKNYTLSKPHTTASDTRLTSPHTWFQRKQPGFHPCECVPCPTQCLI